MIKTIESLLGYDVLSKEWKSAGLPPYIISGRQFFEMNIEDMRFLCVVLESNDRYDIRSLKSQVKRITTAADCPVVLCFSSIKTIQMDALIRNGIPFIVPGEQIYVPFLGIALNYTKARERTVLKKFTPAAQMLFLHLLYGKKHGLLKKDAADQLDLTRTSITRASAQLRDLGLLEEKRKGREIMMSPTAEGYAYYEKGREHLISPIQRKVYVKRSNALQQYCISGETALSRYGLLNEPEIPSYAIDKKLLGDEDLEQMDRQWQADYPLAEIECWKYDPRLFAVDGKVDPVSLACIFMDHPDERIEKEIETLLEEFTW